MSQEAVGRRHSAGRRSRNTRSSHSGQHTAARAHGRGMQGGTATSHRRSRHQVPRSTPVNAAPGSIAAASPQCQRHRAMYTLRWPTSGGLGDAARWRGQWHKQLRGRYTVVRANAEARGSKVLIHNSRTQTKWPSCSNKRGPFTTKLHKKGLFPSINDPAKPKRPVSAATPLSTGEYSTTRALPVHKYWRRLQAMSYWWASTCDTKARLRRRFRLFTRRLRGIS